MLTALRGAEILFTCMLFHLLPLVLGKIVPQHNVVGQLFRGVFFGVFGFCGRRSARIVDVHAVQTVINVDIVLFEMPVSAREPMKQVGGEQAPVHRVERV